jgi:hypothetical protein
MMDLEFPSEPFSMDTDSDRSGRSALQPIPADDNPAAFVLGLRPGGLGPLKNVPSASSYREGEWALSTSATDSCGRPPIWSGIVPIPSVEIGKGVN